MNPIPLSTVDSSNAVIELVFRLKLKDVMTTQLLVAARADRLRSIQGIMKENGITGVPIAEKGRLLGMVSIDDIVRALDNGYIDDPAEAHMSRKLVVLEDDMPLSFAISYFDKYRYGRFPVLNKHKELVGIVTSRDILTALLVEINKEVSRLESSLNPAVTDSVHGFRKEYAIRRFDFESAGKPSTEIKKLLKDQGVDTKTLRRIAVAAYELEMNQVLHSSGGRLIVNADANRVEIRSEDAGPGIADVEAAVREGYSTANDWVRSLGFGAGMGLPNVKRVSDEFTIRSAAGDGTAVVSIIYLHKQEETTP